MRTFRSDHAQLEREEVGEVDGVVDGVGNVGHLIVSGKATDADEGAGTL